MTHSGRLRLALLGTVAIYAFAANNEPNAQPNPYRTIENWFKLPEGRTWGAVGGVSIDSHDHIWAAERCGANSCAGSNLDPILEFDQAGKLLKSFGGGMFIFPHGLFVDKEDNIWVCDGQGKDGKGQQVIKFSPAGKVLLTFGRKAEASDEGAHPLEHPRPPLPPIDGQFRQVTDMAWDSKDNTFISDGYINARVAKYDPDGNFLMSFGEPGAGPGQLNTPHSIAIDSSDNVYVADRGNGRISVFDTSGKFLRIIKIDAPVPEGARPVIGNPIPANATGTFAPGSPWALCITPGPTQYLYAADSYPGRIYKLSLDGKLLGMIGKGGKKLGQFGWIHALACPSENTLFAAEILNWRVQKLTLHPN